MNVVCVTGGRAYANLKHVYDTLDAIHRVTPIDVIGHGGAAGADTLAAQWARTKGVTPVCVEAMWMHHGPEAGPLRNKIMLAILNPSRLVAFPGHTGTKHCIFHAKALGIPVTIAPEPDKK